MNEPDDGRRGGHGRGFPSNGGVRGGQGGTLEASLHASEGPRGFTRLAGAKQRSSGNVLQDQASLLAAARLGANPCQSAIGLDR